jgi:ankyrin repeat protein
MARASDTRMHFRLKLTGKQPYIPTNIVCDILSFTGHLNATHLNRELCCEKWTPDQQLRFVSVKYNGDPIKTRIQLAANGWTRALELALADDSVDVFGSLNTSTDLMHTAIENDRVDVYRMLAPKVARSRESYLRPAPTRDSAPTELIGHLTPIGTRIEGSVKCAVRKDAGRVLEYMFANELAQANVKGDARMRQVYAYLCEGDGLVEAACEGSIVTCRMLLDLPDQIGKAPNANVQRSAALMAAARNGHVDVCRLLLSRRRGAPRANVKNGAALAAAARNGHVDVCRLLLEWPHYAPSPRVNESLALVEAAKFGHADVCRLLLEWPIQSHAAQADARNGDALRYAACGDRLCCDEAQRADVVRMLLEATVASLDVQSVLLVRVAGMGRVAVFDAIARNLAKHKRLSRELVDRVMRVVPRSSMQRVINVLRDVNMFP